MADAVRCCLGFHFHQPPYDASTMRFYRDASQQTYSHHLDVLDSVPEARVNFTFTGVLLEMMQQEDPGLIGRLREKVESGQVYLTACGHSHPIFPIISERYGQRACSAQVERDRELKRRLFGVEPEILRLPEYAYSGPVIDFLQNYGFRGTILPDGVFFQSGVGTDRAMVRPPKSQNGRDFRILARSGLFSNLLACWGSGDTHYFRWLASYGGDPKMVADDFTMRALGAYGGVLITDCDGETYTHWMHESGVPPDKRDVLKPLYRSMLDHGIEMVHLPELMDSLPGVEVGGLPRGSYDDGGLGIWEGDPRHEQMWREVDECWRMCEESGSNEDVLRLALEAQTSCWFWGVTHGYPAWWGQRPKTYRNRIAALMAEHPAEEPVRLSAVA